MDYNKAEILRECRELLQSIKCEIVVDISDGQLFNVLFQSDVKKETLLKWLMQQMYSIEECTKYPMEDLVSIFIPKSQYRSFLIGTMPIAEQYKKWKLIMSVLHKKQLHATTSENIDYEQELLSGSILESFESIWSEKLEFNPRYISSSETSKKINLNEIQADINKAKSQLSQWKSEEKVTKKKSSPEEDKIPSIAEAYKRTTTTLNEAISKELIPHLNSTQSPESNALRYDNLDRKIVNNITKNVQVLYSSIDTLNTVLRGVENFKNQEQPNADLN